MSKFDDLYSKLSQIMDIAEKVPSEIRSEVFIDLYHAIKDDSKYNLYKDEIARLASEAQSLNTFIFSKHPTSNIERSLLFVCYMEMIGLKTITSKHISACYELCSINEPGNLPQNLRDACSSRYGYLESISQNCYRSTNKGRELFDIEPHNTDSGKNAENSDKN